MSDIPSSPPPARLTRAEAARLNGKKSRGPVTPEGKRRSAMNALKHGLTADRFALAEGEDGAAFQELLERLTARYRPADEVAAHLVQRLASVMWRQYRGDRIEAQVLTERDFASDNLHAPKVWDAARFNAVQRYQARLDRMLITLLDELDRCEPAAAEEPPLAEHHEVPNEPSEVPVPVVRNEPEMELRAPVGPAPRAAAAPPSTRPRKLTMPPLPVRHELERLLADGDWNGIERLMESGQLACMGLGPKDVAEGRALRAALFGGTALPGALAEPS